MEEVNQLKPIERSESKSHHFCDGEVDSYGHSLVYPADLVSTNYFYWRRFFPELEEIFSNQAAILEEANNIHKVCIPFHVMCGQLFIDFCLKIIQL